ncbi:translocation/assembly module TamB domain-containing protein [Pararhizobium mangrovi]|uniref:Translocation/assembly module TamB n=1 Tax=Pararhizobium mangrovi TaxID=2590452 RepID=A0A506U0I2_9HYPH|nr:translocation/assembly module TamB domain-containing protein [Pararhizobium mangrovi]TPW26475.1 translocation/assembly module TamB [Pararhizobium mangrovi]
MRIALAILAFLFTVVLAPVSGHAQDSGANSEKSAFTRFVENKLSSENRQIRLNDIQGALSSDVTIGEITIADRQGVWLSIQNAHLVWTRSALLVGRLKIDELSADRIELRRKPLPAEGAPAPSSSGFSVPELPVSVVLDQLNVKEAVFDKSVFGLQSRISLNGKLTLADGSLDTELHVKRLDGPGGTLDLAASYANKTEKLDLDLTLDEPQNGILANLLNIDGKPPLTFKLAGDGPIGNLALDMTLDAKGERALTGKLTLDRQDAGLMVNADVRGPIANLVAPAFRDFFGSSTALTAKALVKDGGGVRVDDLDLDSGPLTLSVQAETTKDNFLSRLNVDGKIANADGSGVLLPVAGQKTQVKSVDLSVDYGNTGSDRWKGKLAVSRLGTPTFGADSVNLDFGGRVTGINTPDDRFLSFNVDGAMSGISTKDPNVKTALGNRITLDVGGKWSSGQPARIANAALKANELALTLAGSIKDLVYDGTIGIEAASIAPFAALANRPLAGSLNLHAKGTVKPVGGAFDLTFDGAGSGLQTGTAALDNLLKSKVSISGGLARTADGFKADDFTIANQQVSIKANGSYAPDNADFDLDVMLADLGLVTDRATGKVTVDASVKGNQQNMALAFDAQVPDGTLAERTLRQASIAFKGQLLNIDPTKGRAYGNGVAGTLSASGFLSGERVVLDSDIRATPDGQRLRGLSFRAGGTTLTGTIERDAKGLIDGELKLDGQNISTVAALATLDASGSATADIAMSHADGRQSARIDASLSNISVKQIRVGSAKLNATVADLFGVPKVDGSLTGSGISAGGIDVDSLSANASRHGDQTDFTAKASLQNGTDIDTAGSLAQIDGGFRIGLDKLDLAQRGTTASLQKRAVVTVAGQDVRIVEPLDLAIAGGHVRASGEAGDKLDLHLSIDALPLSIANTVKPDLAAAGTLSGNADITGTRAEPVVDFKVNGSGLTARPAAEAGLPPFDVNATGRTEGKRVKLDASLSADNGIAVKANGYVPTGKGPVDLSVDVARFPLETLDGLAKGQKPRGTVTGNAQISGSFADPTVAFRVRGDDLSAAPLQNAGVSPLDLTANGRYADKAVDIDARVTGAGGLDVSAKGTVPAGGKGSIDLSVDIARFPLETLDGFAKGQSPSGVVTGSAKVSGSLADPAVSFQARGNNVSATPLKNFGVAPLSVTANGRYADKAVSIERLDVSNSQGVSISASGRAPLSGGGLDVRAEGRAPLALANRALADRGTRVEGTVQFGVNVTGSIQRPVIGGMVSASNVDVVDPDTNVRFDNIQLMAGIANNRVTINRFVAPLASGGTITAGGSFSIDPTTKLPANITINLNQARYTDGDFITVTASGNLAVTGQLLSDPLISGRVDIARADIGIPSNLGGGAKMIDVTHIHTPVNVQETLNRARIKAGGKPVPTARPSIVRLDVTVNAPRRIFVRGRGLDAELGGSLRVTGPVTGVEAVGSFDLIRGHLVILTKRIEFDSGTITLTGALDPIINLTASTDAGDDTSVTITVSGRASDPHVDFSSQPSLPQDEIIAQLIFGRSISDLSAFQIAQLASAVAELSGNQTLDVIGRLREATGLDELDVTTDAEGNAQVRAGSYIRDNVYLGVEAGADGQNAVDLNVDITKNLKAKGSAGTNESTLGLFYEKDY